jgi:predicted ATP-grasp superfamily ATP-dependent carboligase
MVVVQSFINGYDFGCSILCKEGTILACTFQRRAAYEPHKFSASTNIDFLYNEEVYELVKGVVGELKWTGVANLDLRYDEQEKKVKLLEINARFWQTVLGSYYAGINFPYRSTLVGLKRELPDEKYELIHFVNPGTACKLILKNILDRRKVKQYYKHSKLETHFKDPMPIIITKFFQILNTARRPFKQK